MRGVWKYLKVWSIKRIFLEHQLGCLGSKVSVEFQPKFILTVIVMLLDRVCNIAERSSWDDSPDVPLCQPTSHPILIRENSGKRQRLHFYHQSFALLHKSTKKRDSLCYNVQSVLTSTDFHLSTYPLPNSEQLIWKSTPTPTAGGWDNIGLQSLSDKLG